MIWLHFLFFPVKQSVRATLHETNIAPENQKLEDELPFGKTYF